MKNLLGRLHARSEDQRARIAMLWRIPVFGNDAGQHIGRIYQVMTDIRAARDVWMRLDTAQQQVIRHLVQEGSVPLTIAELASAIEHDDETTRTAAIELFFWGILGREGDYQELPLEEQPRVFVPTELMLLFRRVIEEHQAGDISGYPLRRLLELRDDVELETTATTWGLRVMPGMRRRSELITEILDAVVAPVRLENVINRLHPAAKDIWRTMQATEGAEALPFADVVAQADLTVAEAPVVLAIEQNTRLRDALDVLENALLVNHTWLADGSRGLFVPDELRHPQAVPVRLPLAAIQPLPEGAVPTVEPVHPFALAWDVTSVVREIATKGPPVWIPGKELPTHWLRLVNSRLWFRGESEPPPGYATTLLHLALEVGALEPAPRTSGLEKAAIKPIVGRNARWWRGLTFADQTERLRQHWLAADTWIEGRESGEIEVRGADWVRFRHRLLTAVARIDPGEWVMLRDASKRLAEQDPTILGDFFEVATVRPEMRQRASAIAVAIEVELTTAFTWFGFVETQDLGEQGVALRVTQAAVLAAQEIGGVPDAPDPSTGPILTVNHEGTIHLRRPSPLHIWSLTAFADNEQLQPSAVYQMRPTSIGIALAAGFDLSQITAYLERWSGQQLPDPLITKLREWTAVFKRVKLRRAVSLELDVQLGLNDLKALLTEAGYQVLMTEGTRVLVMLPDVGNDADPAEDQLAAVLRKAGYASMWLKSQDL